MTVVQVRDREQNRTPTTQAHYTLTYVQMHIDTCSVAKQYNKHLLHYY